MWHKIVLLVDFVISKICIILHISHCEALKRFKYDKLQLGAAFEILLSVIIRYQIGYKGDYVDHS